MVIIIDFEHIIIRHDMKGDGRMTLAYSQKESVYLFHIKQYSKLAALEHVVTWQEIDEFEKDVLHNEKGIQGLSQKSKDFIRRVERYMEQYKKKAC